MRARVRWHVLERGEEGDREGEWEEERARGTQMRRRPAAGVAGAGQVVPPPRIRWHVHGADDRRSQRRRAGC